MAAQFKPCSVEDCNRSAHYSARGAAGFCCAHYSRFRTYGDPHGGGTSWGAASQWLQDHASHAGHECLIWPYSRYRDGYGQVRHAGQSTKASRAMCILAHGEPTIKGMEAAHSCGNGHLGCVNPVHLRWDSAKGNCADRAAHGTENRGNRQWNCKLSEEDVRSIRSLHGEHLQREIAQMFGVSRMTVTDIINRKTWAWLP